MNEDPKEEEKLKKNNKPPMNIFKKGFIWRPVPRIYTTIIAFFIVGAAFLVIGIILVHYSKKIKEESIRYDDNEECEKALKENMKLINEGKEPNNTCSLELTLDEDFESPVMIYYQLENFYQNYRRYIKSFSPKQLKGEVLDKDDIKDACDPIVTIADLGRNKTIDGTELPDDAPANPCGLIARSLFNDSFTLQKEGVATVYDISSKGIAWDSDLNGRYKRPDNYKSIQWTDVEDERFMVWMRPAGLPNFRKLWGKIEEDLPAGKYIVNVESLYPVDSFDGKKYFVLSTVNKFGGNNMFLGVSYIVVGGISLFAAIFFLIAHFAFNSQSSEKKDK